MILKINSAHNPDELKILRTKGYTVVGVVNELRGLINNMAETCVSMPNCVGLAANQVWDDPIMPPPAIFIIRMQKGVLPFINPVLDREFKRETDAVDGCMSVAGKRVRIRRPYHILTSYLDGEGHVRSEHFYDIMARIWMHEYDHVQGRLIIDHE
jgi:peptide deformylase